MKEHSQHLWEEKGRDENADRVRTVDECRFKDCPFIRYGCFAKRLDVFDGEAWGPVGEWRYRVVDDS